MKFYFFLLLFTILLSAQNEQGSPEIIDNTFYSLSVNELYYTVGLLAKAPFLPHDIHVGSLEDYHPGNVNLREMRTLTEDFLSAFSNRKTQLQDIIKQFIADSGKDRVQWTIAGMEKELRQVRNIRIGRIQRGAGGNYFATVRIWGDPGSMTAKFVYQQINAAWKIIDVQGDFYQLDEPYEQKIFVPGDVLAPLTGS